MRLQSLLLLAVIVVYGGCVWPPNPQEFPPNGVMLYDVHYVSQRWPDGSEHASTIVSPDLYDLDPYVTLDSLQYIIVNGDTVYRNLGSTVPAIYNSAAPYHLDGKQNIVTLVFPYHLQIDTSFETGFTAVITSPRPGDTLLRDTATSFTCHTQDAEAQSNIQAQILVTDSNLLLKQFINLGFDSFEIPSDQMSAFRGATLWANIQLDENFFGYGTAPHNRGHVTIDRIVAYPLK